MTPLRYFIPFRQYVKFNRTIIKLHTFRSCLPSTSTRGLYLEQRYMTASMLSRTEADPSEHTLRSSLVLYANPSIATFRQDRALDEVFRQQADSSVRTVLQSNERRKTSNVVNNWMKSIGEDDTSPPPEQDRRIVDRLERRRSSRLLRPTAPRSRNFTRRTMSVASDPEDFMTNADLFSPVRSPLHQQITPSQLELPSQHTDADGDDELPTDDNDDDDRLTTDQASQMPAILSMSHPFLSSRSITSLDGVRHLIELLKLQDRLSLPCIRERRGQRSTSIPLPNVHPCVCLDTT